MADKNTINDLIMLADKADKDGKHSIAHNIDLTIKKLAQISIGELVSFADYLDKNGLHSFADEIDGLIKQSESENDTAHVLSTRHCPDHNGVQTFRIAESVYQCPMDGKVYNYGAGYVNYNGQHILGGSVSEQTPSASDYGGIPSRTYDSRHSLLNNIG